MPAMADGVGCAVLVLSEDYQRAKQQFEQLLVLESAGRETDVPVEVHRDYIYVLLQVRTTMIGKQVTAVAWTEWSRDAETKLLLPMSSCAEQPARARSGQVRSSDRLFDGRRHCC